MERLEKIINILKETRHLQPELVKEASHRILARNLRSDPNLNLFLKPIIEILIKYCDNDDSAQRSLFNDHLNGVILTFQHQYYQQIFQVLLDIVINNGTARAVTAALHRIAHLINNVKPIELGCEPQALLKSLIEVARRADDESVLKALDFTLKHVMPFMDYHIRKNKDMFVPAKSLIEVFFTNLQNESSQTKRLAASSISIICLNSDQLLQYTLNKLKTQLDLLSNQEGNDASAIFVGFCLCVKEICKFSEQNHALIIEMILLQINKNSTDITLMTAALETLRDLSKRQISDQLIDKSANIIADTFLLTTISDESGTRKIPREEIKIILQSNALACISVFVKQRPSILDQLKAIFLFRNHSDIAISNQVMHITGNYIDASWRYPLCVDQSVNCEQIRKLWVELRSVLNHEFAHPDTLKSCVIAMKTCVNTLLESDHCLHIIEHQDFDLLIQLYLNSTFKPFKIEVLGLFANLNYRTIFYLERCHWSKIKAQTASSYVECLQERVVNKVIIASLINEHERVRQAAIAALVNIIPCLYLTNANSGQKNLSARSSDPIVSLSNDLANQHLVVLKQADEHLNHFDDGDEPVMSSQIHERLCIRIDHRFLSSSIIQSYDNPYNEQAYTDIDHAKTQHRVNITINLMYVVGLLKSSTEDSLDKGKTAISSIVKALYELSIVYPIYQYSPAWDCRASEYCDCFTLLNFLLTYLENLTEPDVVVEDLEAYRNFLCLCHQLLYALCHESVLSDYEHQKMKSFHKRQAEFKDGYWSELVLKHCCIADMLDIFFTHLVKLLWLSSYIIEERNNPFSMTAKQSPIKQQQVQVPETFLAHGTLTSNRLLFGRVHKKLESSYKSSKKNLNQSEEKFYQMLETCLESMSQLLEFIGMNKTIENVKDILGYLKITSDICSISSLVCARQLLKSLFGINILALYQLDPNDWFEEESWPSTPTNLSKYDKPTQALQGVYHHLIANPYKIFSTYYSYNCSQITPTSDRALSILNFESRRALKVRRRIEDRVKSLFEFNPLQLISPKLRQISEILKNTITEFTPVVTDCMTHFSKKGFHQYQSETLHFMSYLILLRVNYQKLALAENLINSIHRLLDDCGEKVFSYREEGIETFLRNSFTFLTLLTYERGPSKPMFQVATVIQKLDDIRAKLSMSSMNDKDVTTYVAPLLRCLVEDLFIYRTKHFQEVIKRSEVSGDSIQTNTNQQNTPSLTFEMTETSRKDIYELLEAERETVARKLLDVIENPRVYDLISILILESRRNPSEIKYKKLSQQLLSLIPTMLSRRNVNLMDYRCVELTRRIIENISPEVFHPVNFIFETLLEAPKPKSGTGIESKQEFQRYMSLVLITIHILITQVKEEVFLTRLRKTMSDEVFVEFLLHIAQLCISEINIELYSPTSSPDNPSASFLAEQLASYILYLTHMLQSGLFFQISRTAVDLIRREVRENGPRETGETFKEICEWSRNQAGGFSLLACERMFFNIRLVYPDLSIFWCNIMMLLNNVDCNRDYWRDLLVYECHHCSKTTDLSQIVESMSIGSCFEDSSINSSSHHAQSIPKEETRFRRGAHINRPSSLNLSDISFNDQLRRSFIKKIADAESKEKTFNRNIIETSDEDGQLMEREVTIGNTEQCLSPNIELTRRGALCLVLDFVTISMNDVEHITWLIIHYINDIIRWSYELPITEFINAVHGNSASSGIFIQAINSGCNNLSSISFVSRLLWCLEQVHYTQYGSLVVLLVEKLLSSDELMPYKYITRNIEEFACSTVKKLLNETNKSLVTTNDEVLNQLGAEDLDRVYSLLDEDQYPRLTKLLVELRESTSVQTDNPTIALPASDIDDSDDDSQKDDLDVFNSNVNLIFWLAEQNHTAHVSTLIPALNTIKDFLCDQNVVDRVNSDETLVCFLVSAIYSLALNHLQSIPHPKRLVRPSFWNNQSDTPRSLPQNFTFGTPERRTPMLDLQDVRQNTPSFGRPVLNNMRPNIKTEIDNKALLSKSKSERSQEEMIEALRVACLKSLFLLENIDYLRVTQFEYLVELIIRIARLPLLNSFLLTPPALWRHNIWPLKFDKEDLYKTSFPIVTHEVLSKDLGAVENFCDRLIELGWINRRQFEEAWMTLLGVLSTTLSQTEDTSSNQQGGYNHNDKNTNLLISCKVVSTITKLLSLTRKSAPGDPLSSDLVIVQNFDDRVIDLTRAIASNLSSLKNRTQGIFEQIELERKNNSKSGKDLGSSKAGETISRRLSITSEIQDSGFSSFLRVPAQKLRMNAILNVPLEVDMHEIVVIDGDNSEINSKTDEVDVESCIRLLLSLYKQNLKELEENLSSKSLDQNLRSNLRNRANQMAPPLATAICQSILALSDMFADYEQFDWMFETFVDMFKIAERNDDEILMEYLILGLSKSASVCCYEIPNELSTLTTVNHRDIMFEKCRQCIEKCLKTDFGPLKLNTLFSVFYMLEDSINIVASGAWELDHFKQLRQSRMNWIVRLMPVILDKNDFKQLTKKVQILKLLETLCEVVTQTSK